MAISSARSDPARAHIAAPAAKRLLVVDDSALMRKILRDLFFNTGRYEVQTARNGADALQQIERFNPDVITLDVNMPEMDGLTCLSHIMARFPRPVVMVSSITQRGAQVTLEALALGAVDFVGKPGGTVSLEIDAVSKEILGKVDAATHARPRMARAIASATRSRVEAAAPSAPQGSNGKAIAGLVLIGVSTGGPRTLEDILPLLPATFPWPVVVAQHMPAAFTASFAARLDGLCALRVQEVSAPTPLARGNVYIARGSGDVVIERKLGRPIAKSVAEDDTFRWHPSVDKLVASAMRAMEPRTLVGVQLTGMGDDGARAMADLCKAGGRTIAEDASTAVVFGMPGELIRLGGATKVLPSDHVADQLNSWIS
jgi:two-component system, chemotaxis family, protein-glutamate methylesterase/glutaminase